MNKPVSSTTASTTLIAGPANAMIMRCQRGLARKRADRGDVLVARLLAGHLDVAAEQDRARTGNRFRRVRNPNSRGPKPKLKVFDLHVEEPCRPIVAQFVDQDHHPDQNQVPPDIL